VGKRISRTATQRRGYILAFYVFRELRYAISVEKRCDQFRRPMADKYLRKTRKFTVAATKTDLLNFASPVKNGAPARAGTEPCRVVVVGDTCVSEQGMATIVGRDKRYQVCGSAHGFFDAGELIRKHKPDVLLIEPFLEDRDGILWIKELAKQYRRTRILIVSRQSERLYAERALQAGAAGYWMKNGSAAELLRAVATVAAGEIYVSPLITSLAVKKFARRPGFPQGVNLLSDRELAVFALIAAEQGVGQISKKLGISRKTVETHAEHIKLKLDYSNAEALKRGARELLGTTRIHPQNSR
jgi:two-component system response regulator NreC